MHDAIFFSGISIELQKFATQSSMLNAILQWARTSANDRIKQNNNRFDFLSPTLPLSVYTRYFFFIRSLLLICTCARVCFFFAVAQL